MESLNAHKKQSRILLQCGVVAPLLYIITDLIAGSLYKGYNFSDQAVSELFAIGAPTSRMVVILFSTSSFLYLLFGWGVCYSSGASRLLKWIAFMLWGNAINSLLLWIFFPMHMRGEPPTFTDTMHGVLAINPFVLVTIIL